MKKVLLVIGAIVFVLVIAAAAGFAFMAKSKPVPVIEVGQVDLEKIRDGSYTGDFDAGLVKVKVKVDVADHKISSVNIVEHQCGLGKKADAITEEIVKAQSLDVDVVSGASLSSKAILKAVETALEKGSE